MLISTSVGHLNGKQVKQLARLIKSDRVRLLCSVETDPPEYIKIDHVKHYEVGETVEVRGTKFKVSSVYNLVPVLVKV